MILQLNPPIPVITPKGKALAHAIIDTGIESHIQWVCFQDSTGECWTYQNPQIRAQKNTTHGRDYIAPFYNPSDCALKKEGGYFCLECGEHDHCSCEDEEDEDCIDDLKEKIDELKDEVDRLEKEQKDYETDGLKYEKRVNDLEGLIRKLIKDDHIFPHSKNHAVQVFNKTPLDGDFQPIKFLGEL